MGHRHGVVRKQFNENVDFGGTCGVRRDVGLTVPILAEQLQMYLVESFTTPIIRSNRIFTLV